MTVRAQLWPMPVGGALHCVARAQIPGMLWRSTSVGSSLWNAPVSAACCQGPITLELSEPGADIIGDQNDVVSQRLTLQSRSSAGCHRQAPGDLGLTLSV
jgi:hypothetical protein